ncbi:MAG TPA: fumarylacetoacetate hydrolase family protein [Polyangiales bacterium]|nr:fumarylacetoacetate hydrolase family protein [Polyangiales bacterium]
MRIYRIEHTTGPRFAREDGNELVLLSAAPWANGQVTSERVSLSTATLLAPVEPTKIVCVGRNYRAHAAELGNQVPTEPLLFIKPNSALLASSAAIVVPAASQRVEHEAEIGVVIGKRLKQVSAQEALQGVFGVTPVNDVTARDIQKREVQFTRAKGFDTFCPVGPAIVTDIDPLGLSVIGRVNGEQRQHGSASQMVFDIGTLLSFISHVMTLEPGDLVSTGTPEGVGPLVAGDTVEVEIPGVGVLKNSVR